MLVVEVVAVARLLELLAAVGDDFVYGDDNRHAWDISVATAFENAQTRGPDPDHPRDATRAR